MSDNDGFATEGREVYPHVYGDSLQVGEFSIWPQASLEERYKDYTEFLERKDISPRTRKESFRILTHLTFELCWRAQEEMKEL